MLRRGVRNTHQTEPDLEICGEAVDGQDAVDKARELHPDLVILDINMPASTVWLRCAKSCATVPPLKLRFSWSTIPSKPGRSAAGAHGFVSKGKDTNDLLRVVRNALERNTLAVSTSSLRHLRANRGNPPAKVTIIFLLIY
jgi:DNA-binding NarL/FixJ family response regulator